MYVKLGQHDEIRHILFPLVKSGYPDYYDLIDYLHVKSIPLILKMPY